MVHLILFVLASYGLFAVLSDTDLPIWGKLRDIMADRAQWFAKFIVCPLCFGFWCSVLMAEFIPLLSLHADFNYLDPAVSRWILGPFVQGLAGAAAIYLIEQHVDRLMSR